MTLTWHRLSPSEALTFEQNSLLLFCGEVYVSPFGGGGYSADPPVDQKVDTALDQLAHGAEPPVDQKVDTIIIK